MIDDSNDDDDNHDDTEGQDNGDVDKSIKIIKIIKTIIKSMISTNTDVKSVVVGIVTEGIVGALTITGRNEK